MHAFASDIDVLIVGAGPTGLTLAIDLARRGVRLRLIDQAAAPFAGSRGKGLQPRSLEVFEDLERARPLGGARAGPILRSASIAGTGMWRIAPMMEGRPTTSAVPVRRRR